MWSSVILTNQQQQQQHSGVGGFCLDTIHAVPVSGLFFTRSIPVRCLDWYGACERLPFVRAGVARVVACAGEGDHSQVNGMGSLYLHVLILSFD